MLKHAGPAPAAALAAPKAKRRMRPDERRAQLVRMAVRMAAHRGLDRFVHADVASAARVSTPTTFQYFSDREALLTAAIAEVDRFYRDLARRCHDADRPPMKRIHDHVFSFSESLETDEDYAVVWLDWSTHFRNEYGLWDAFVNFQEYIIGEVGKSIRACQGEGTVNRKISSRDSARLIVAGAYALTQLKLMKRGRRIMERFAERIITYALT